MAIIFSEYLEIDAVPLATHAYWIESLAPLFNLERRGRVEPGPYMAGGISYRHRRTSTTVALSLNVYGDRDVDGVATADAREGLYAHLHYLEANLLADVDATRTATWHLPDATTRTAEVNVLAFTVNARGGDAPHEAVCRLELSIPMGRFA